MGEKGGEKGSLKKKRGGEREREGVGRYDFLNVFLFSSLLRARFFSLSLFFLTARSVLFFIARVDPGRWKPNPHPLPCSNGGGAEVLMRDRAKRRLETFQILFLFVGAV